MAKIKDERHRYGQHYTPREVALLLAAFGVRSPRDLVFDPSCGDGRLLEAALHLKAHLASQRSHKKLEAELFGIDRSAAAARPAARTGARVAVADFFEIEPGARLDGSTKLPAQLDCIIGNPPYIRQEVLGERDKQRIERRLESDRAQSPENFWPRWSGRSDIYVYFFARSIRFLRDGGRLVFLTASSWLDVGYGAALRGFLLKNFRIIAIIESAAESFFRDASINTCISVLERETNREARETNAVRFVQLTEPLCGILKFNQGDESYGFKHSVSPIERAIEFARLIEKADCATSTNAHRLRVINQSSLLEEHEAQQRINQSSWGKYLRAGDVLFRIIERGSYRLRRLSDVARVRFGMKTGANDFFYLAGIRGQESGNREEKAKGRKRKASVELLSLNDVARVRRGLTTGANEFFYLKAIEESPAARRKKEPRRQSKRNGQQSRFLIPDPRPLIPVEDRAGAHHLVEAEYLSPIIFSLKDISSVIVERRHARKLLFNCAAAPDELAGTRARDYIKRGERAGFHRRPTCAARERWYSVTSGMKPAPLIFPSKVGERWLIAINRDGVFEDKKLYGIFPQRGISKLLLAALLNSTWARYCAEVLCRQMTGAQAIADIDVAVAERILLPDPRTLAPSLTKKLEAALMAIARRPVLSIFEEVNRADRRKLDELVLMAIGFNKSRERKATLDELYKAAISLVRARIGK